MMKNTKTNLFKGSFCKSKQHLFIFLYKIGLNNLEVPYEPIPFHQKMYIDLHQT